MKTPILKDILTPEEFSEVDDLRLELLQSATKWERDYYKSEIYKIFDQAILRYCKEYLASSN
ncbi:hypothetical protein CIL03_08620 [Virgibacillus indicus]|uniref:Uncharacterized protein n=1 Tax=Virgibacillus indicus TaxID=2024554 RepID=A0A265NC73_9BACI|nr:hypothetical protein [Virgibacillus indicus]OZU89069.1 hypothetical protein CIL03_08620 [Virgibacillus indicus]